MATTAFISYHLCHASCHNVIVITPLPLVALCILQVGNEAAVLGFVGAPFTLATYIVEGGSSKNFAAIKRLAFGEPAVLHALLDKLADNVADYVRYQVRAATAA